MSEPSRGEQGGPGDRVHFLPLRLGEPDLGQYTARSGVPIPDRGPQTFVPGRSRPVPVSASALCIQETNARPLLTLAELAFDLFMTLDRVTVGQSQRWLQAWNGQVPDTLTGPLSR